MPIEFSSPMLTADSHPPATCAQLYLRTPSPRGRLHGLVADAVSQVAGQVVYAMTWTLCALLELGDPGPQAPAAPAPALPLRTEKLLSPTQTRIRPANGANPVIARYPSAAQQVTPVVQQGTYSRF